MPNGEKMSQGNGEIGEEEKKGGKRLKVLNKVGKIEKDESRLWKILFGKLVFPITCWLKIL